MLTCTSCGDQHPPTTTACPRTGQPVQSGVCGTQIDRYQVERLLGDGGMGAVYRARHMVLNQPVAIKLLHPEFARRGDMLERFLREARASVSVGNEHIIRVHDSGMTQEGRAFIVMELLDGQSLEDLLQKEGRLAPARAVALVTQVLDGLGAAHGAGIVHRDMKPANVFVRRTNDPKRPEFVTVLDFGISKVVDGGANGDQKLTQTGAVLGTPLFMAPEQIMSPQAIDHRADIYATAVMLYQMLSGKLPYEGDNTAELIVKACTTAPTPLRQVAGDLPMALIEVVEKAMAREPADRWQSAAEFSERLRAALASSTAPQGSPFAASARAMPPTEMAMPAWTSQPSPFGAPTPPTMSPAPPPTFGSAPQPFGAAPLQPYHGVQATAPGAGNRTLKVVLITVGAMAAICTVCVVASLLLADHLPESQPSNAPTMQPVDPPQPSMQPVASPPQQHAPTEPAPEMAPIPHPTSAPTPDPAPVDADGVEIGEPLIVGELSAEHMQTAFEQLAPRLQSCRPHGAPQHVSVLAIVHADGSVPIARPADDNEGDAEVARCVANRLRAMAPIDTGNTNGIVSFPVALAPR